jgi:hypothetical protein
MKYTIKKIFKFFFIFIASIILIDTILSIFFEKEVYTLINNKINLIPLQKSSKQIDWTDLYNIDNIPYWTFDYR